MIPLTLTLVPILLATAPPVVVVDRDNVQITESCIVRIADAIIPDADGNGVIHVVADGVIVDLDGAALRGAPASAAPDTLTGTGIRITGKDVTLRRAILSGYQAGVWATGADGLTLAEIEITDVFRQRLRSTPEREDATDWLRPHENDANEWLERYGAAVYIEDAERVTVHDVRVRRSQNGILLDRVNHSRVFDNDCCFLSGWGLALWRSSFNDICRNALDFCVRGYSHGVYNRGQDSAGILLFEQCLNNYIALNSATHCGDGFFGFAGREALGEAPIPPDSEKFPDPIQWYQHRGNNRNILFDNDFSYAAAHGIELTFSFENVIARNRIVGNAICGIWGGYSQATEIHNNRFESNGEAGYGLERGGINIEHGHNNIIYRNTFVKNACGVHLWSDDDPHLLATPWAQRNHLGSSYNVIVANSFRDDEVGIQVRRSRDTLIGGNRMTNVATEIDQDAESRANAGGDRMGNFARRLPSKDRLVGVRLPVGAYKSIEGRDRIIMTEWGPYDWQRPLLHVVSRAPGEHRYELLGVESAPRAEDLELLGEAALTVEGNQITVKPLRPDALTPYTLRVHAGPTPLAQQATFDGTPWQVRVFAWQTDPGIRLDESGQPAPAEDDEARHQAWLAEAGQSAVACTTRGLDLRYEHGGPSDLDLSPEVTAAALPADRFGTMAEARVRFGPGRWQLTTRSDDGIRVWLDDQVVIDDWTWHPPKTHTYQFTVERDAERTLRVEHFELDGFAVLSLRIDAIER